MSNHNCLICLEPIPSGSSGKRDYHPICLQHLFGTTKFPTIDIDIARLHTFAGLLSNKVSLSGVQRKVALSLVIDKPRLFLEVGAGNYILKPQGQTYPHLPENEHVTMLMAKVVGITTPPLGLIKLTDGTLAYIIRRFDRTESGLKRHQEDFCQLAEKSPKEKYDGSAELCVRLVRRFASEPVIEMANLYRLLVFSWWSANGDMHLKNFSLLHDEDVYRLSPAYDLLCTELVIANDALALPVGAKTRRVTRQHWLEFAQYCRLPERAATRILSTIQKSLPDCRRLVERSLLPPDFKERYQEILAENSSLL